MSSRPPQVRDSHVQRKAVVYVRQSSEEQVRHNVGSLAVQRDVVALLEGLGWPPSRIEIRDEDLGVSGATAGLRQGFNALVEEMAAGAVGIVGVADSSRLTRNLLDLARFAEAAQRHDVLLVHGGQITDFRDPNSAFVGLILGLNAARENQTRAELGRRARRKKAEAGIATTRPPRGYVWGTWAKEPDVRVREVLTLVFDKFLEFGSAGRVLRYFRRNKNQLPTRSGGWADATRAQILRILKNAAYAGFYEFGKTASDPTRPPDAHGRRRQAPRPKSEWIRIPSHHEPYVAPHLWDEIQQRIGENRNRLKGPIGRGGALVQGLLRCTIHRTLFKTTYPNRGRDAASNPRRLARYHCDSGEPEGQAQICAVATAVLIDRLIEFELLGTLSPPSLADLRQAAKEALRGHESLLRVRGEELSRAKQGAAEAERAYDQADADQPLLKRRLGQRTEDALARLEEIDAHHRLHPLVAPLTIGEDELAELQHRVTDLSGIWRHPSLTPEHRKHVVRTVIKSIHVTPTQTAWGIELEWISGARSAVTFVTQRGVREELERAYNEGLSPGEIADRLKARRIMRQTGPHVGEPFDEPTVRAVIRKRGLQDSFDQAAYVHIRTRALEGATYRSIADELNANGIRHYLGPWTRAMVATAVANLRQGRSPWVSPLPRYEKLDQRVSVLHKAGLCPTAIVEQLRSEDRLTTRRRLPTIGTVLQIMKRLGLQPKASRAAEERHAWLRGWGAGHSVREIAQQANTLGLRTRHGNPWTENAMARKLAELGLRVPKKRHKRRIASRGTTSAGGE